MAVADKKDEKPANLGVTRESLIATILRLVLVDLSSLPHGCSIVRKDAVSLSGRFDPISEKGTAIDLQLGHPASRHFVDRPASPRLCWQDTDGGGRFVGSADRAGP